MTSIAQPVPDPLEHNTVTTDGDIFGVRETRSVGTLEGEVIEEAVDEGTNSANCERSSDDDFAPDELEVLELLLAPGVIDHKESGA